MIRLSELTTRRKNTVCVRRSAKVWDTCSATSTSGVSEAWGATVLAGGDGCETATVLGVAVFLGEERGDETGVWDDPASVDVSCGSSLGGVTVPSSGIAENFGGSATCPV